MEVNIQAFWVFLFIIFAIIELMTVNLVTMWFSLSALIVFFISSFVENIVIQFLIFSIFSLLFILYTRPIISKFIKNKVDFNSSGIGDKVVVKKIEDREYLVKYKGALWSAVSDKEYEIGDEVTIIKFEGNKIII